MGVMTKSKEKVDVKVKKPKLYRVIMYNDDFTTMEFVVQVLTRIFGKNETEAEQIMMDVHNKGKGMAGVYTYDIAVTKVATAMKWAEELDYPFKMSVEEAE